MEEYLERRIKNLQNVLEEGSAVLISPGTNFYYLTGLNPLATLERLFLLALFPSKDPIIIAPKLYENELKGISIKTIFWSDEEDPYLILKKNLEGVKKIIVEDSMPSGTLLQILSILEGVKAESLAPIISEFRMRKSKEEISLLQKAADVVDRVYYHIVENEDLRGKTEKEIAELIIRLIKEFGGEDISFSPIVASGPNGANPHHTPGERKIRDGDLVILDYGAKYRGYCSDITRTLAIGKISDEARKVYETVKEAQETAFQRVAVGVRAKDIDLAAREVISSKGYGEYFIHRTGHGLGLDVHEEPFINSKNDRILENGMVFTIEPGIYLPGKLGVRIEDDVYVDGRGVRLTKAERELREI